MATTQISTFYRDQLLEHFSGKLETNFALNRKLVSYQADKQTPFYRWCKYKEGFSSQLVRHLLTSLELKSGLLLDPFAGSGIALFEAAKQGWQTQGIELLPVGNYIMEAQHLARQIDPYEFAAQAEQLKYLNFSDFFDQTYKFEHVAITSGAFTTQTQQELIGYIAYCNKFIGNYKIRRLALFAAFCILEEISYTRKDGQYLRWDSRSGRSAGKTIFNKGEISSFTKAIQNKLEQMTQDLFQTNMFETAKYSSEAIELKQGSCLIHLPTLTSESIDLIFTSPPYCNRYDYTRTYALELVYLGANHQSITNYRQQLLSCTVENKSKKSDIEIYYKTCGRQADFYHADSIFNSQTALQEILSLLERAKNKGELNNDAIVRMVHNYFYEMTFVILEMARILKIGGYIVMVNDNVRYAGEEIPVDLILSSIAEQFGLTVEHIWSLPTGKGNSSQQMGLHGRSELRKSVLIWKRANAF